MDDGKDQGRAGINRGEYDAYSGRFDLCRRGFAVCLRRSMVADPCSPRARQPRRRRPRRLLPPRTPGKAALCKSRRARDRPGRGNRHHRRPGVRFRAFQAARFPARQGSGADVRRWPVAGQYALGPEDAGGRMHDRYFLSDRQARDLLSGNPQAGCSPPVIPSDRTPGRTQPHQQEADRRSAQGRDRKRLQRGEMGAGRRFARAVLPLPGAAASAGNGDLSRHPQHRDVLLRSQLLRLQGAQAADR